MSREIKFRAWDGERMYHFDLRDYMGLSESYQEDECPCSARDNLMQYTGLSDKNSVPIYEGDIVRCNYTYDKREWPEYKSNITEESTPEFVVNFEHGGFVIRYTRDYSQWCPWSSVGLAQFRWYEKQLSDGVYNEYTEYSKDFAVRTHQRLFNLEVIGNIYENPELLERGDANQ